MYIIDGEDDWWLARKKDGGEEGYIPSNFVTEHKSSLHAKQYVGLLACTRVGTFCLT